MSNTNNCRKFTANIFDKTKCQNCFRPKESHSAEALESNKIARKIFKCAYLFVAPESFDFNNALYKTRRWQRRFFVLYDDGELTYSVDENVNTVPQGVIDMNQVTEVVDAEPTTGHQFSICVATEQRRTYIKGGGKDEITRWFDVLQFYPRSKQNTKKRRTPTFKPPSSAVPAEASSDAASKRQRFHTIHAATCTADTRTSGKLSDPEISVDVQYGSDNEGEEDFRSFRGLQRSRSERGIGSRDKRLSAPPTSGGGSGGGGSGPNPPESPAGPIHYRGVRSLKHKHDKMHTEGALKKSSSVHDIPETRPRAASSVRATDTRRATTAASPESPAVLYSQARLRSRSTDRTFRHSIVGVANGEMMAVAGSSGSPAVAASYRTGRLGGSQRALRRITVSDGDCLGADVSSDVSSSSSTVDCSSVDGTLQESNLTAVSSLLHASSTEATPSLNETSCVECASDLNSLVGTNLSRCLDSYTLSTSFSSPPPSSRLSSGNSTVVSPDSHANQTISPTLPNSVSNLSLSPRVLNFDETRNTSRERLFSDSERKYSGSGQYNSAFDRTYSRRERFCSDRPLDSTSASPWTVSDNNSVFSNNDSRLIDSSNASNDTISTTDNSANSRVQCAVSTCVCTSTNSVCYSCNNRTDTSTQLYSNPTMHTHYRVNQSQCGSLAPQTRSNVVLSTSSATALSSKPCAKTLYETLISSAPHKLTHKLQEAHIIAQDGRTVLPNPSLTNRGSSVSPMRSNTEEPPSPKVRSPARKAHFLLEPTDRSKSPTVGRPKSPSGALYQQLASLPQEKPIDDYVMATEERPQSPQVHAKDSSNNAAKKYQPRTTCAPSQGRKVAKLPADLAGMTLSTTVADATRLWESRTRAEGSELPTFALEFRRAHSAPAVARNRKPREETGGTQRVGEGGEEGGRRTRTPSPPSTLLRSGRRQGRTLERRGSRECASDTPGKRDKPGERECASDTPGKREIASETPGKLDKQGKREIASETPGKWDKPGKAERSRGTRTGEVGVSERRGTSLETDFSEKLQISSPTSPTRKTTRTSRTKSPSSRTDSLTPHSDSRTSRTDLHTSHTEALSPPPDAAPTSPRASPRQRASPLPSTTPDSAVPAVRRRPPSPPLRQMNEDEVKSLLALVVGREGNWEGLERQQGPRRSKTLATIATSDLPVTHDSHVESDNTTTSSSSKSPRLRTQRSESNLIRTPGGVSTVGFLLESEREEQHATNPAADARLAGKEGIFSQVENRDLPHTESQPIKNEGSSSDHVIKHILPTDTQDNDVTSGSKLSTFRSPTKAAHKTTQSVRTLKAKSAQVRKGGEGGSRRASSGGEDWTAGDRGDDITKGAEGDSLVQGLRARDKDPQPALIPLSLAPDSSSSPQQPARRASGGSDQGVASSSVTSSSVTSSSVTSSSVTSSGVTSSGVTSSSGGGESLYRSRSPTSSLLLNGRNKNETDEHKMAKTLTRDSGSSPLQSPSRSGGEDCRHSELVKKGWLLRLVGENDWVKNWFVLTGSALNYYRDSASEDQLEGSISLDTCSQVIDLDVSRYYRFKIKFEITVKSDSRVLTACDIDLLPVAKKFAFRLQTAEGDHVLSATTSIIQATWLQAIQKCVDSRAATKQLGGSSSQNKPTTSSAGRQHGGSATQSTVSSQHGRSDTQSTLNSSQHGGSASQSAAASSQHGVSQTTVTQTRPTSTVTSSVTGSQQSHRQLPGGGVAPAPTAPARHPSGETPSPADEPLSTSSASLTSQQPVRLRPKTRDTRSQKQQQENRHSLDLSSLETGGSQGGVTAPGLDALNRRLTMDDYSALTRLEGELKRQDSQDSILSTQSGEGSSSDRTPRRRRRDKGTAAAAGGRPKVSCTWPYEPGSEGAADALTDLGSQSELSSFYKGRQTADDSFSVSDNTSSSARSSKPVVESDKPPPPPGQQADVTSHFREPPDIRETWRVPVSERLLAEQAQLTSERPPATRGGSQSPARLLDTLPATQGHAKVKVRAEDATDASMNEIIEQKWREVEKSRLGGATDRLPASTAASSTARPENTLSRLLETEVEALKSKLEKAEWQLSDARDTEKRLSAQLNAERSAREALTQGEQTALVAQLAELQEELEQNAEYFRSRLQEQDNRAEVTKLQVQSLRSQLAEARESAVGAKQVDAKRRDEQLGVLEREVRRLEAELEAGRVELSRRDQELNSAHDSVRRYTGELESRGQRISSLEGQLERMTSLREELVEKSDLIGHLSDELDVAKQQLRKQDGVMQKQQKDFSQRVKQMEDEFYAEKEKLERSLDAHKSRLEQVLAQSNMADNMADSLERALSEKDDAIAQLEERVIETDARLDETQEELSEVLHENASLKQDIDEAERVKVRYFSDIELSKKEVARLKNQLTSVNADIEQMKVKKDALAGEQESLYAQLEDLQNEASAHAQQTSELQQVLAAMTEQLGEVEGGLSEKQTECERLHTEKAELETAIHTAQSELEMARGCITELESQQQGDHVTATDKQQEVEALQASLQTAGEESERWQDKFIEASDELERLKEALTAQQQQREGGEGSTQLQADLDAAKQLVAQLQLELSEQLASFERDLEDKCQEVSRSQDQVSELQDRLSESENSCREQTALLASLREKELLRRSSATELLSPGTADAELSQRYKDAVKDVRQTRLLLQETERRREEASSESERLRAQLRQAEMNAEEQLSAAAAKNNELTAKLQATERRLRRFDKRRQSGIAMEDDFKPASTQTDGVSSTSAVTSQQSTTSTDRQLESELVLLQRKVSELSMQLLQLHSLEVEFQQYKHSSEALKRKNVGLEREIALLRTQMENTAKLKFGDVRELALRLVAVESRLGAVREQLGGACRVVERSVAQLRASGQNGLAEQLVRTNTELHGLLEACGAPESVGRSGSERNVSSEGEAETAQLRVVAERLSLEALVLGALAGQLREGSGEQDSGLVELQQARHCLHTLAHSLAVCGAGLHEPTAHTLTSSQSDTAEPAELSQTLTLLSKKLRVTHELSRLLSSHSSKHSATSLEADPSLTVGEDSHLERLAQQTLFRVLSDEKTLPTLHTSHSLLSTLPHALTQRDITLTLDKLSADCIQDSQPDRERVCGEALEWAKGRAHRLSRAVDSKLEECLPALAELCTRDIIHRTTVCQTDISVSMGAPVPFSEVLPRVFDPDELQNDVIHVISEQLKRACPAGRSESGRGGRVQECETLQETLQECVHMEATALCSNLITAIEACLAAHRDKSSKAGAQSSASKTGDKSSSSYSDVMLDSDLTACRQQRRELLLELTAMLAARAVAMAQLDYTQEMLSRAGTPTHATTVAPPVGNKHPLRKSDSGVVVHSASSLPTSPVQTSASRVLEGLQHEASIKSDIAALLQGGKITSLKEDCAELGLRQEVARLACELYGVDRSLAHADLYADLLGREAVLHAQLAYSWQLQQQSHAAELEQLRHEMEQAQRTLAARHNAKTTQLQNEVQKLETECASLRVMSDQAESRRESSAFSQELEAVKQGYELRIRSLQQDVQRLQTELESSQRHYDDGERQQGGRLADAEGVARRLREYCEELSEQLDEERARCQQVLEEREAERLRSEDDVRLVMRAVSCHEVEALEAQVSKLQLQLEHDRQRHMSEIERLYADVKGDSDNATEAVQNSRIHELEQTIHELQEAALEKGQEEQQRARQQLSSQLQQLPADDSQLRARLDSEIDKMKEAYDRIYADMDSSHRRVLTQMRREHKRELEELRQEKEQVLAEETRATQAALDALRKTHEAELQRERNKFLDLINKTYSQDDFKYLTQEYEERIELLNRRIHDLSREVSVTSLERNSLTKRLDLHATMLSDSRKRNQDLLNKNQELSSRLRKELERLNKLVAKATQGAASSGQSGQQAAELQVALKVKEAEAAHLSSEVDSCEQQVRELCGELDASVERYSELYDENRQLHERQAQLSGELNQLQLRLDQCSCQQGRTGEESPRAEPQSRPGLSSGRRVARLLSEVTSELSTVPEVASEDAGVRGAPSSLPRPGRHAAWRQRQPERARSNPGPMMSGAAAAAVGGRQGGRQGDGSVTSALTAPPGGKSEEEQGQWLTHSLDRRPGPRRLLVPANSSPSSPRGVVRGGVDIIEEL